MKEEQNMMRGVSLFSRLGRFSLFFVSWYEHLKKDMLYLKDIWNSTSIFAISRQSRAFRDTGYRLSISAIPMHQKRPKKAWKKESKSHERYITWGQWTLACIRPEHLAAIQSLSFPSASIPCGWARLGSTFFFFFPCAYWQNLAPRIGFRLRNCFESLLIHCKYATCLFLVCPVCLYLRVKVIHLPRNSWSEELKRTPSLLAPPWHTAPAHPILIPCRLPPTSLVQAIKDIKGIPQ